MLVQNDYAEGIVDVGRQGMIQGPALNTGFYDPCKEWLILQYMAVVGTFEQTTDSWPHEL